MASLPSDLIAEILSRLPAKSVGQCRCVCKSWFSLTFNPTFIKLHLNRAIQQDHLNLVLVCDLNLKGEPIYINRGTNINTHVFSIQDVYNLKANSLDETIRFQTLPFEVSINPSKLSGSCNGIICLIRGNQVCLLNPCTREYKIVNFENKFDPTAMYGFGYDPTDQDYKVAQFVNSKDFDSDINLYSLDNPLSSLTIPNIPYQVLNKETPGVFLNGAIHWVADHKDKAPDGCKHFWLMNSVFGDVPCRGAIIIAFDIKDKMFREIRRPDVMSNGTYITMGVLGGQLCILCNFYDTDFQIWVMKEYGVQESWSKLYSMKEAGVKFSVPFARPLCYFRNGEILLNSSATLLSCDPKQIAPIAKIHGLDWDITHRSNAQRIATHVSSLVPLKSGTYLGLSV